jgi:D-arginine utilization repressor
MENIFNVAKGFVQLLAPFVEVVIHDLGKDKIIFIEGGLSKRQVGDPSFLEEGPEFWQEQIHQQIYPKIEYDGRLIKSLSIPLQEQGRIKGLICLNFDVSAFQNLKNLATLFIEGTHQPQPEPLFKNDWHERIHQSIAHYLQAQGLSLAHLTHKQKREIVQHLDHQGAFAEKNAADYIAKVLNLGRATIFNYLRSWRKKNDNNSL